MSLPISAPKPPASDSSPLSPKEREAGGEDRLAEAYDSLAPLYDSQLEVAQWVRRRLWNRLDALFPPGSLVLDVTAGTGLDAIHLAGRGVRVIACDISPKMLAELRAKNPLIETRLADFHHLNFGFWNLKFDGLISTFAGLNTSPDLQPFADSAAQLLRPGGILFAHMLNRWPVLDITRRLAHRRWRECEQLLTTSQREIQLSRITARHYFHLPLALYRNTFAEHFDLRRISAQGLLRPVDARWGSWLEPWETAIAHLPPFHSLGTFFALELRRR